MCYLILLCYFMMLANKSDFIIPIGHRHFCHFIECVYLHIFIYHHHHHHVVLAARISLTLCRYFSLSFIASGRSSGQHPVSSHSCWMYVRAGRGGPQEYITYEFVPASLAVSRMSGSSNLNSFHDRRQVAVQLVSCGVLPPGLVQDCSQHSCVIAV